jgi:hypothetical protein
MKIAHVTHKEPETVKPAMVVELSEQDLNILTVAYKYESTARHEAGYIINGIVDAAKAAGYGK